MLRLLVTTSPLQLVLIIAAGLLSGVSTMALISLITALVSGQRETNLHSLYFFIALCFTIAVTRLSMQGLFGYLSQKILLRLRVGLCLKIIAAPLSDLEKIGAARIVALLTSDVPILAQALLAIPTLAIHLSVVCGAGIYLVSLSPGLFATTVAILFTGVTLYLRITHIAYHYFSAARSEYGVLQRHFRALVDGVKELKMNRRWKRSFVKDHILSSHEKMLALDYRAHLLSDAAGTAGSLLFFVLIGILIFLGPVTFHVSASVLTAYVLTVMYTMGAITATMNLYPLLVQGSIAHARIGELENKTCPELVRGINASPPKVPGWANLKLSQVTYTHASETGGMSAAVGPIDLTLSPGEIVFIVGGNGSGKTTVGKLLCGLYVPASGVIEFDGKVIDDRNRDDYRQLFSVVFSDFYLFDSLLGDTTRAEERAEPFLTKLRLAEKVTITNGAFSTVRLSAGERKRLALLAAYLEDKQIFVMDEWAADQDPEFKDFFYRHLLIELKQRGKCVVLITHDERYFSVADRMIRISAETS